MYEIIHAVTQIGNVLIWVWLIWLVAQDMREQGRSWIAIGFICLFVVQAVINVTLGAIPLLN